MTFYILRNLGEPLRASRSRRAIRSITFGACRAYGGSAAIPLAKRELCSRVSAASPPLVSSMLVSST
jgi:hypothetical protein